MFIHKEILTDRFVLVDSRASAVLYSFLVNQPQKKIILLPVNICPIVPEVIIQAGFEIEYVDISQDDFCLNEEIIFQILSTNPERYSGILFNYTYGVEIDKTDFFRRIKQLNSNRLLIEDKCLNSPSTDFSSSADLTLFSTGYAKQVNIGYGGYGFLKNTFRESEKNRIVLKGLCDGKPYEIEVNSFSKSQEQYFEEIETQRQISDNHKKKLNTIYQQNIPIQIQLDPRFHNWRFQIVVENQSEILEHIFSNKLFASNHYIPLDDRDSLFPVAFNLHKQVINLFNDLYFDETKAIAICEIIKRFT